MQFLAHHAGLTHKNVQAYLIACCNHSGVACIYLAHFYMFCNVKKILFASVLLSLYSRHVLRYIL